MAMPGMLRAASGAMLLLLTACSMELPGAIDKDGGSTAAGDTTGGSTTPPFEPTIEAIQQNVFTPICFECHSGNHPSGGMSLADAQTSYDNLVNVPTGEARSAKLNRVTPGDPDNSYIIHKLEGTQEAGSQMPDGCPNREPCLDQATIDVIRQWISNGALPPGSPPPTTP